MDFFTCRIYHKQIVKDKAAEYFSAACKPAVLCVGGTEICAAYAVFHFFKLGKRYFIASLFTF